MKKSDRLLAFETLYKIFQNDSYSNLAVDSVLKGSGADKGFVTALVYGVVERKLTLDYLIDRHVHGRLKPKVRLILRMGAYQLLFMDKVPDAAAVHESVALAKTVKQDYYCPLINAVLHKIAENKVLPEDLSIQYSVPAHLIGMWIKAYGEETVRGFLPYVNGKAPIFAVPNPRYVDAQGLLYALNREGIDGEIVDGLVRVSQNFNVQNSRAFANGLFHVQDLSCYNCCRALDVHSGDTVLDVCAAPGGKSFTLAELMQDEGNLLSFDLHPHRVGLIQSGAERLGLRCVHAAVQDALVYSEAMPPADHVLCDVPCSGFGIIRRKPEIRYKELDSVKQLPQMQLQILNTSVRYLKRGGSLVYSTCTLNKRENEEVVRVFLNQNHAMELVEEKTFFPSAKGSDGFYYALLRQI